ncbi:MAG: F420-nonreducing hydrogenase [Candidatus Promineifilaceae bacterium]|nr:F420-nonreducing hydrogenase [Candidatus Promineifilaceae bacterium]
MSENGKSNGQGKLAMYWAASCGGCEISFLNIGLRLLDVDEAFDVVFLPCVADFKVDDVRGYDNGYIDLCLFNGAIRNSENEAMAHLLREKSKIMVAFGSCAYEGCIPALANLTTQEATLRAIYLDNPSTDNADAVLPQPRTAVAEGELELPELYETVKSLDQVVEVDYTIPGCPPEATQIWAVLQAVIDGVELPPTGTILGADRLALCEECPLTRDVKKIDRFYRPHEKIPEPDVCLLEQGLLCMGPATRAGCGALCPQVGMGCRGCYGPLDGVEDQGARMLSAVASVMDVGQSTDGEAALERKIQEAVDTLADPAGTFYRFSMAHSLLRRARTNGDGRDGRPE